VNWWRFYWAFVIVGLICVPEVVALVRKQRSDTLSEAVWYWCRVTPGNTVWTWTAFHVLVFGFFAWLFIHLMFGFWR
jgi:hypothetical protein